MLVGAMNPCRCGYFGHASGRCTCKTADVKRYISKISGPMLDRIDIQIELPSLSYDELSTDRQNTQSSAEIRQRVCDARIFARKRMETDNSEMPSKPKIFCNAQLDSASIRKYCKLDDAAHKMLKMAYDSLGLSARGYDRILRVARTVADLDKSEIINTRHIGEAIQYRSLDRKYWG